MYPDRELTRLWADKASLQRRITLRRLHCAVAAAVATQPLVWVDRMLALWRQYSPLVQIVAVPLGFLLKRSPGARPRLLGILLRWSPIMLGVLRGVMAVRPRPTAA
jgi:hypothetical protein